MLSSFRPFPVLARTPVLRVGTSTEKVSTTHWNLQREGRDPETKTDISLHRLVTRKVVSTDEVKDQKSVGGKPSRPTREGPTVDVRKRSIVLYRPGSYLQLSTSHVSNMSTCTVGVDGTRMS